MQFSRVGRFDSSFVPPGPVFRTDIMSDSPIADDGRSFDDVLTDLIEHAYRNGGNPEGAYKCTIDGNGDFHWDVQITRVEYEPDDD